MTVRAQAYLCVAALRHLALGIVALTLPGVFGGAAMRVTLQVFTLQVWAVLFIVGGAHLAYSAGRGHVGHARVALVISACMTSAWAGGFLLAFRASGFASPLGGIGGIVFTALVLKDLVQCGQPLRSPFEPIVRKYVKHQAD